LPKFGRNPIRSDNTPQSTLESSVTAAWAVSTRSYTRPQHPIGCHMLTPKTSPTTEHCGSSIVRSTCIDPSLQPYSAPQRFWFSGYAGRDLCGHGWIARACMQATRSPWFDPTMQPSAPNCYTASSPTPWSMGCSAWSLERAWICILRMSEASLYPGCGENIQTPPSAPLGGSLLTRKRACPPSASSDRHNRLGDSP